MFDNDFFRLHSINTVAPEKCPHMILGGCGYTSGPFNLYRLYASFLPKLKNITPEFMSIISKIVGGLFYIMFIIQFTF